MLSMEVSKNDLSLFITSCGSNKYIKDLAEFILTILKITCKNKFL